MLFNFLVIFKLKESLIVHTESNSESPKDIPNEISETPAFKEMKMRAEAAEAKLRRIYNTPFWKITKPLRKIYARLNQFVSRQKEKNYVFTVNPNEGASVIELTKNKISIELNNADLNNPSIAIVAQWSNNPEISQSLENYLKGIIREDYSVILISACESPESLSMPAELKGKITLLRKPNLGYDFGSWAVAFETFPQIFNAENLILTNDSLIGPLSDFSQLLEDLEKSPYDITGITDNAQLQYHIQSYLMHFNKNAIENLNIQNFLKSIVHLGLKNDVILKYELGLTRTAQLSGLYVGALFPWNIVVLPGKNPSLKGWNRLFELGFPFLKREAVRLGSHFEVNSMIKEIERKYPDSNWAISEIKSIS